MANGDQTPEQSKHAFGVLMAEHAAVRAVIERRTPALVSLISLNVTGIAAIAGLVLSDHADPQLLLTLPILCSALGLAAIGRSHESSIASAYVQHRLGPKLARYVQDDDLLGWESYYRKHRDIGYWTQALALFLIFLGPAVGALAITLHLLSSAGYWVAWCLGAALTLALALAGYGLWLVSNRTDPAQPHPPIQTPPDR